MFTCCLSPYTVSGKQSPSRIPTMSGSSRPSTPRTVAAGNSGPVSPVRLLSPTRSKTPTNIPTLRKSQSQSLNRQRYVMYIDTPSLLLEFDVTTNICAHCKYIRHLSI